VPVPVPAKVPAQATGRVKVRGMAPAMARETVQDWGQEQEQAPGSAHCRSVGSG